MRYTSFDCVAVLGAADVASQLDKLPEQQQQQEQEQQQQQQAALLPQSIQTDPNQQERELNEQSGASAPAGEEQLW